MSRQLRRATPFARIAVLAGLAALASPTLANAASAGTLHVTSRSWEVGEAESVHNVASGGKLEYCEQQPTTGLTPVIAYSHAPVGKSYTVKLVGPAAAGTIPPGVKTKFKKSSGRVANTYATPSFPGHQIVGGVYTFSMFVGGKTVASVKLTLDPLASKC